MQHFVSPVITETHILKLDCANNVFESCGTPRVLILGPLAHDFLRPFQPRQRLSDLSADRDYLQNGCDKEHEVQIVGNVSTWG